MNKQEYINEVLTHIKNKSLRGEIEQELNNHISERESYYIDMGYDADKASEAAVKKMGSPAESGEKFNRIYTSVPSLIISIIMLAVFIAGLIYYFVGNNFVDYTIISSDSEAITLKSIVASFFTFASGAVCFRLAYKNRFGIISIILGILYLLSTLAIWIFLPVGGSIFGFFFDFPAVFFDEYFFFFGSELCWGIDSYISNASFCTALDIIEILLVSAFFFSALINGVMTLHMGAALLKNDSFIKNEKKYKRFSSILILITIICAFTMTAEASVEYVKITNQNSLFSQSEYSDYEQAKAAFDGITLPVEMTNDDNIMMVCENEHYMVQVFDDNDDGIGEKNVYWQASTLCSLTATLNK